MNLKEFLNSLIGKIVIVSIGNPLRGDDAIGSYIAKEITNKINAIVIDCEDSPERYLGEILQNNPDTVIFIDALEMKAEPGSIIFLEAEDLNRIEVSTHRTALKLCADYISKNLNSRIIIVGIQPEDINFGADLSKKVLEAADTIKALLISHINSK